MSENSIQRWIEELILIVLIIINVLEFFGLTKFAEIINIYPGEIEFIKTIISMTGIAYVFFKVSPTKIFFGDALAIKSEFSTEI